MLGKLGQSLGCEIGADGKVLHGSAELVTNLFVNRIDDFLAREHNGAVYRGLRGCNRMVFRSLARFWIDRGLGLPRQILASFPSRGAGFASAQKSFYLTA